MTKNEFSYLIGHLNDTVNQYWPCAISIWLGYLLAPFTLGLSFMIPNVCIKDAKVNLVAAIERQNRLKLKQKDLQIKYMQAWSTSWLEIRIIGEPQFNQNQHIDIKAQRSVKHEKETFTFGTPQATQNSTGGLGSRQSTQDNYISSAQSNAPSVFGGETQGKNHYFELEEESDLQE